MRTLFLDRIRNLNGQYLVVSVAKESNDERLMREGRPAVEGGARDYSIPQDRGVPLIDEEEQHALRLNSIMPSLADSDSLWLISYAARPACPLWAVDRPQLLQAPFVGLELVDFRFLLQPKGHLKPKRLPRGVPLRVQEGLLIEDLLFCMMGASSKKTRMEDERVLQIVASICHNDWRFPPPCSVLLC